MRSCCLAFDASWNSAEDACSNCQAKPASMNVSSRSSLGSFAPQVPWQVSVPAGAHSCPLQQVFVAPLPAHVSS